MSRQTIRRIYTEDKRRATIVRAIYKQFESLTLQATTGCYRGKPEKSIVLEIVGAKESEVKWLAARIREINR
jgi:predicted transcriptional regulator